VTLAPSPTDAQFVNVTGKGELQLLASDSIYASGFAINTSTANPVALPSVFRPGFIGQVAATGAVNMDLIRCMPTTLRQRPSG
jgi:hypothetical protein